MRWLLPLLLLAVVLPAVVVAAAGSDDGEDRPARAAATGDRWARLLEQARGQTVNWWMYGGDERVNAYVRRYVKPAARRLAVTVRQVPVTDTADAVARVVAQRRAGRTTGGSVDLIWINGENFAAGKKARLWLTNWARQLPNSRYVNWNDASISRDFQVPVDGQEAPWSRAAFVFAHDSARVPDPQRDLDALLAWARQNPGRLTYPAPPDFTGAAFVRQVVQAKGEDAAFAYLDELTPLMHRGGRVLPKSEAELNDLFANGEVDFAMSYDANFVLSAVRKGQFPESTRPFVLGEGALTNVSYVTIPKDAAHRAGAQVVANLLLDPRLQAIKADPEVLGSPTVLDRDRLPVSARSRFAAIGRSPHLLRDFGASVQELEAGRVAPLEARWKREVLR